MLGTLLVLGMLGAGAGRAGPRPLLEQRFVVAIDPGHGGSNSGCRGNADGPAEKAITLALALELRAQLEIRLPHAKVVLTREGDETVALAERVARANAVGPDLFLSLHANASEHHDQHGFETFVLDAEVSDLDAAWTARRENDEAVPRSGGAGSQAELMLGELRQAALRGRAIAVAVDIQSAQARRFPARIDRGVKQARFDVLLGLAAPAVLFEAGFLDDGSEAELLVSAEARAEITAGLADAVVEHYRRTRRVHGS